MSRSPSRVLITGAAGSLGRMLRTRFAGQFELLRLADIAPMAPAGRGEEVVPCDLADEGTVTAICKDIDAIVHLGGQATEAPWPVVHGANILGAIHLWEGALKGGVGRILFASSNHAVGLWRRTDVLDHTAPARPDGRYGLSKAFGEDIAQLYAYKHGIRAFCMRIGSCFPKPVDHRMLSTWMSYDDCERLVRTGLGADYVYEIVYGISRNTRAFWDNANAYRLGYDPQDDAETYAAEVAGKMIGNPIADAFQGGSFVTPEFVGDPSRIP